MSTTTMTLDASVASLPYQLANDCPATWPEGSGSSLSVVQSYPFTNALEHEQPSDFVLRAYWETLWLPEAITSLSSFVPTLRRVHHIPNAAAPSSSNYHPLSALLQPLLLHMKSLSTKYRTDIPQMIASGGTGDDAEEAMILFAWSHEKRAYDMNDAEADAKWTKDWLGRLERRDALLQVLAHMLILTLPGRSSPASPKGSSESGDRKRKRNGPSKKKKSKSRYNSSTTTAPSEPSLSSSKDYQTNLELLTDRLLIWRDTQSFTSSSPTPARAQFGNKDKDERDWLQIFCEDVVRPSFKLPLGQPTNDAMWRSVEGRLYTAFRAKCFPESEGDDELVSSDTTEVPGRKIRGVPNRKRASDPSSNALSALATVTAPRPPRGLERTQSLSGTLHPSSRPFARSSSVLSTTSISMSGPGTNSQSQGFLAAGNAGRREVSMRRSASIQREPSVGAGTGVGLGKAKATATGMVRTSSNLASASTTTGAGPSNHNRPRASTHGQSQPPFAGIRPATAAQSLAITRTETQIFVPETPIGHGRRRPRPHSPVRPATIAERDFGDPADDPFADAVGFEYVRTHRPPWEYPLKQKKKAEEVEGGGDVEMGSASVSGGRVLVQETPARQRSFSFDSFASASTMHGGASMSTVSMASFVPETPLKRR